MNDYSPRLLEQLPPDINDDEWPSIRLKQLELKNFGKFDHILVDFTNTNASTIEPLSCLVGPNGTGKTTILTAIQMLFARYSEYDRGRYDANMQKYIRNWQTIDSEILAKQDFMVKGTFARSDGDDYVVELTKLKRSISFHPEFIAERLPHYCFFARFDQELHLFQLKRNRWKKFKTLFESITGYEITENENIFDIGEDTRMKNILKEYIVSFSVKKPEETINYQQCSAGERKLIKTFSTLLNKSVCPDIILIDNAVMHIEVNRHLAILNAIKKCFDKSQVIVTCHSEPISRMLSGQKMLIDMRFAGIFKNFCNQPYRVRLYDELRDIEQKLEYSSLCCDDECLNIRGDITTFLRILTTMPEADLDIEPYKIVFENIANRAYHIIQKDLCSTSYSSGIKSL